MVVSETDNPDRFVGRARLRSDLAEFPTLVVAETSKTASGGLILHFAGITDRTRAERLVGASLLIDPGDRRSLDDDEYWPDDLEGLAVVIDGAPVGRVTAVVLGPQTRLAVSLEDGSTFEVPFVPELVPDVDVDGGYLVVAPIEGLINPR